MKIIEKIKKTCRLCKNKNLVPVYDFQKSPIGDDYQEKRRKLPLFNLKVLMCKKCKFAQLSNVIDPNKVYGEYIYVTQTSTGLVNHFSDMLKYLQKKNYINRETQVMEIGSNDGSLLNLLNDKTYFNVGVDPAVHLTENKNFICEKGLYSFEFSKKLKKKYHLFDVIIANNVIANIDNLNSIFRGIKNNLVENGYFVMETFSLSKLLQNNLIDNVYHEHLSYFTFKSLDMFSKKFGLKLIDGDFLSVKGGSLRLIFKKTKSKKPSEKIKNLIKFEEKNLDIRKKFKQLKLINIKNASEIKKYLEKHTTKNVYGFGASVGTTTLIYDFKLTNILNIIFDNEAKRSNLFLPNTNILVKKPNGKIKKNSIVIVFAWRYFKSIIKKNKSFFRKDTVFLLPLPKFKIIKS